MFGKNKKEEPKKEQSEIDAENAEIRRGKEEKETKRKQDYVDEKMKLTEKELFVELLWSIDEMREWDLNSIRKNLIEINLNTKKPSSFPLDDL